MVSLDSLIDPLSRDQFFSEYYGIRARQFTGDAARFDGLFGWEDINHLVPYTSRQNDSARLVLEKKTLTPDRFQDLGNLVNKGATYVINHLQTKDPVIDRFARTLSAELNSPVNINCYISARSKQGFDTHYDRHDVFIVQTEGTKQWRVFEPTLKDPLECMKHSQPSQGSPPDTEPYIDCELSPGDVLYIPRGHWHYALARESTVHLTVGVDARTGIDFMAWLLGKELWGSEFMRRSFPIAGSAAFGGSRPEEELRQALAEFSAYMTSRVNDESLYEQFREFIVQSNWMAQVPQVEFPAQVLLKETLGVDTEFELPVGQKVILRRDPAGGRRRVVSRGLVISVEGVSDQVLEYVTDPGSGPVTVSRVLAACPGSEEQAVRTLLLSLAGHGVLRLRANGGG